MEKTNKFKPKNSAGYSLVELLVSMAIFPIVIFTGMTLLDQYNSAGLKAREMGIKEDARTYIRTLLDCRQTAVREAAVCKTGGYIRGYDAEKNALSAVASTGRDFDGTKVRLHCSNDGVTLNIQPEILLKGSNQYDSLDGIPITCKICGVDVALLPASFPPPPIAAGSHRLLAYINGIMSQCGEPGVPGDSILETYGAGSKKGKEKPFIKGTLALPTMTKICNMLGFQTFVSSSCVEDGKDTRCNYTSPSNNDHVYWNGTSWVSTGNASYTSWLSRITCTDPL